MAYALEQAGAGSTIVVKPGIYRGPITIATRFAGTAERPTVIRSEVKWQAIVIGSEVNCIWTDPDCNWVVIDGFQVMGARFDGIKLIGDHNTVRNCWSHNNGSMGIASHGRRDVTIERNLVEYNGSHVQFHHGLYVGGVGARIIGNVIRHNAGWGLHLYPEISDSVIANNLVYGQAQRPGMILACPEGGGRNRVVNNTFADNGAGIDIVRGNGEVIANNVIAAPFDPIVFHQDTRDCLVDHNLCSPPSEHQGPHGRTSDPLFVDRAKDVYWLAAGSPAIGGGSAQYAPQSDFWGRPMAAGRPVDIGCFPFAPELTGEGARAGWYYAWPYQYYPNQEMGMPDLWLPPGQSAGGGAPDGD